ncbi:hypothetical protein VPH35_061733 [Triticum aestivum]|uniref:No apical meristem-associated C-terminal domain-containing protein n=1 Tax=Aegilops tauschii subsp. strangulata TaxID=200361 RepID=A0A453G009_AEGTS
MAIQPIGRWEHRQHRDRSLTSLCTTTPPSSSEPPPVRCLTSSTLMQCHSSLSILRRRSSGRGRHPRSRWVPARCSLQCPKRGSRRMTRTGRCSTSSTTEAGEEEGAMRMGGWKTRIPPGPATTNSNSPTPRRPRSSLTSRPMMAHNSSNIGPSESSVRRGEEEEDGDGDDPDDTADDMKKKGRGKSFNMREDELLCDAWLATSVDPIHGMEQKGTTFWRNIHIWFHEHKHFAPTR